MKEIRRVAIAGAGTMGYSLAQAFAAAGYPVRLYDLFPAALDKARDMIALNQQTEVSSGKLTEEQSAAVIQRISFTSRIEDLADTDFLVEAILEKLEVKHEFYRQLCGIVAEDAILCSNTSGLSITKIAEAVTRPERFAGMHWMNPPHIIPLIEIVEGEKTAPETAELVRQVALGMKKKPVIVKDAPSFVLNRLQQAILRESLHIVEQGIASPEASRAAAAAGSLPGRKDGAARMACRSSALPCGRKKGEPCGSPFIFANRSVRTSCFPERPSAGRRGSDRLPGDQRGILWACGGLRRP